MLSKCVSECVRVWIQHRIIKECYFLVPGFALLGAKCCAGSVSLSWLDNTAAELLLKEESAQCTQCDYPYTPPICHCFVRQGKMMCY